jgi:predicted RNA methylase
VFDYAPADALDNLIITGETEDLKKKFQFFPTPLNIAELMCRLAELSADSRVLEPSCGEGDLADVIHEQGVAALTGIELNPDKERYLADKPYQAMVGVDFLEFAKSGQSHDYTHIVMNPPFSCQQDVDHIRSAFEILNSGGVLVSVVSVSPFFRTNKKSADFRDWLDANSAEVIDVPAGAFKASGTNIPTRIIKIVKE